MSSSHKAALAQGRAEGRVVRRYLEALEQNRPKRGRKRTIESVKKRLDTVNGRLPTADPLARLHLLQEKADLETELERGSASADIGTLEAAFVQVALTYGQRKGVGYSAWRTAGVSAAVLQRAGVTRVTANNASPKGAKGTRSPTSEKSAGPAR
jgi:hypothetical protein